MKLNHRQPSPSAPVLQKNDTSKLNEAKERERGILKFNSRLNQTELEKRALKNLDEMVKGVYDNDLPGMCWPSSSSSQPSNSKSEGNLRYLQNSCE